MVSASRSESYSIVQEFHTISHAFPSCNPGIVRHDPENVSDVNSFDVQQIKDLFVEALSHGMQQRIGIARTLLHDPQVLILDEPANGLDPQARIDMRLLLLELAKMGKTLIVTSHILPELARVCDLVAIITKGKLRAFGTLDEIMREIRQERTFEIQLTDADRVDRAAGLVAQWLSTSPENVTGARAETMIRFATKLSDLELAPLLTHLIEQGETIAQFREVTADLEDAFLSATKEDVAAPASGAAPSAADASPAGSARQAASP